MAQVFENDRGHRHAKSGREILHRHGLLPFRVGQELNQAAGQIQRISSFVKLDRQLFTVRHLAKIRQVGANDGYSVGTGQMCDTAATGRRRIGHDCNRAPLEEIGQIILMHVAGELYRRIAGAFFPYIFHITRGLGMVAAGDDQPGVRKHVGHGLKCIQHEFKAFIGSPLSERQNAVLGIAAPREIRIFRPPSENAVRPDVNILMTILFGEDPAVAWHEYRHRIGQEQHSGSNSAGCAVETRMLNPRIF